MEIYKGEFLCIIGEVGSGKSSLINAILGDMVYLDEDTIEELGSHKMDDATRDIICKRCMLNRDVVKIGGSLSFVQQTPWIQNMTIRDNILFGAQLDENRYNQTIKNCQLESDLEILKGGDLTEIGEKGINLSGGQKARVSLARAVYADCDIVLMDDPISALDSHVKRQVFEEVFCGDLRNKTRILVTHAVDFLDKADRIVIMESGKVKYVGTYEELQFSDEIKLIIDTIAKTAVEEEDIDDQIIGESSDGESSGVKNYMSDTGTNITEDENKEVINVSWRVYVKLFFKDKNWITYFFVLPVFIVYAY